jgi:hypothetical protein
MRGRAIWPQPGGGPKSGSSGYGQSAVTNGIGCGAQLGVASGHGNLSTVRKSIFSNDVALRGPLLPHPLILLFSKLANSGVVIREPFSRMSYATQHWGAPHSQYAFSQMIVFEKTRTKG